MQAPRRPSHEHALILLERPGGPRANQSTALSESKSDRSYPEKPFLLKRGSRVIRGRCGLDDLLSGVRSLRCYRKNGKHLIECAPL